MELYEKALFEAFVWTQAIESEVHDLILNFVDDGRFKLHHEQCDKLGELTLGRLIEKLKPCVEEDLYNRLKELNRMRNEVVHRSNYVENIVHGVWLSEPGEKDLNDEIRRFQVVKNYAENIYVDLLGLFQFGEPPEQDC